MKAFLDVSAFRALIWTFEESHEAARKTYESLVFQEVPLHTSSFVLLDTSKLIQERMGSASLKLFLESVTEAFSVMWVGERVLRGGWNLIQSLEYSALNLSSATSLLLAEELDAHMLTFDPPLRAKAAKVLP